MDETGNRNIKILGIGWLAVGGLAFTFALITLFPFAQGNPPSATEIADGYWVFVTLGLVTGAIAVANGLALVRRNLLARPLLTVSSILLLPSAGLVVPLLVVAPNIWLTLSKGGKETFESYLAGAA